MMLDNHKWKEFNLCGSELGFKNYHGKRLVKEKRKKGKLPLLTAGFANQGVADFISNDWKAYKNCITIDMFGNAFYHNYLCSGDDNIYFFVNDSLSDYIKIFITSCISVSNKNKFSYGKQFRQNNADNTIVMLPVDSLGNPDYEFMESYIKEKINLKKQEYINYIKM